MPKLTNAGIARYKAAGNRREIPDTGSDGLILLVHPTGSKTWIMRFRRPGGRLAKLTLGTVDTIGRELSDEPQIGGHHTLAAARRLVAEIQRRRKMGEDVVAQRRAAAGNKPLTFEIAAIQFVETYAKQRQRRWRDTARDLGLQELDDQLVRIRGSLADIWRDRPVTDIGGRDIAGVLEETVARGAPYAANGQLATFRKMFNWLRERHLVDANPCTGIGRPTPVKARERVLSDAELRRVWTTSADLGEPWTTLIRLLILTGQRLNEVARMEWAELNDDVTEWTIPGERTKNRRTHVVPLSTAARDLLVSTPRIEDCSYILTTNGKTPISGTSKMKRRLDQLLAGESDEAPSAWRLHDLRRTVATGMARVGVQLPVIERILNHVSGSFAGIVGVYQRHEYANEKREALERWADLTVDIVSNSDA